MTDIWKPFPKQEEALLHISDAFETLFGGSRGPGKTDCGLVWLTYDTEHPRYRALVIRKNANDLTDWVDRATRFYHNLGVTINYRPPVITFPKGGIIRTGHLKDDQAYTKYMGHEYHRMLIEELTQIPDEKRYLQLIASCRSTIPELRPRIFNTTNPGGVGHGWVKRRFVDPAPPNTLFADPISSQTRIFIPATLDDNPILQKVDPDYIKQLDALKETDIELWKAWRLGDWNTFAGQFFKEFRTDLHVVKRYFPSKTNLIIGGMDWGRTAPFSFHLAELKPLSLEGTKFFRVTTFLEVYGTDKTPKEWSGIIKEKIGGYGLELKDISFIQGDPRMFTKGDDKSISIADQFKAEGIRINKGSNERIGGWENYHNWLSIAPDGLPYYQIAENCVNLIRTLPELIHDENIVEDVDTDGEDHAPDEQRYMLKRLKWLGAKVGAVPHEQIQAKVRTTAEFIGPKQVSIDLRKFELPQITTSDSGVGAIIHR